MAANKIHAHGLKQEKKNIREQVELQESKAPKISGNTICQAKRVQDEKMTESTEKIDSFARADYHIHPNYSFDAKGSIEEFVLAAIAKKLERICFTTHIDMDPNRAARDAFMYIDGGFVILSDRSVRRYLSDIERIQKKYANQIDIAAGFEFSYEEHYEHLIKDFISKYNPDFTIGSIHSINGFEVTSRATIAVAVRVFSPNQFFDRYYEIMVALARSKLFSTIGHFDGYKKYLSRYWGMSNIEQFEQKIIPDIAPKIADTGATFEINSSGFRKGLCAPYPSAVVIRTLVENGVEIGAFGSDAHRPEDVGSLLSNSANYVKAALSIK